MLISFVCSSDNSAGTRLGSFDELANR